MTIKKYIAAAAVTLAAAAFAGNAAARDFTIASWGGGYQDSQRKHFFKPFGDSRGIKVLEDTYLGGWAQFKAMQETGNRPWDVVQIETSELIRGCEEGLFVKLDWSKIGPKDSFIKPAVSECGLGVVVVSQLVAYNPKNTKVAPSGIEQLESGYSHAFGSMKMEGETAPPPEGIKCLGDARHVGKADVDRFLPATGKFSEQVYQHERHQCGGNDDDE